MSFLSKKNPAQVGTPQQPKEDPKYADGRELPNPDESRMITLGVIIGHERKSPGASLSGGGNEYLFNTEIASLMAVYAKQTHKVNLVTIKRDGIGISGAYDLAEQHKCDCVIELHFNAYNQRVSGTSTLCTGASDDIEFAHAIQKAMCKVFERNGESRGVQAIARNSRGGGNVYGFPKGANCLVEPFFGDNPKEAQMANERKGEYARALVDAVILWATKKDLL